MGFFTTKKEIKLEDFCRDFYETQLLNSKIGEESVNPNIMYAEVLKKSISGIDGTFASVDVQKLADEITVLRFELFALAWTHKFISGKTVIAQSAFTKRYLKEKGKEDIWEAMVVYNNAIDGGTLHWLSNLGKTNLVFNHNMRKDLALKNAEEAYKNGTDREDSLDRENNRLWSENAWKQKIILGGLLLTFCNQISINGETLNREAQVSLMTAIAGFYMGAQQSWDNVKIIN